MAVKRVEAFCCCLTPSFNNTYSVLFVKKKPSEIVVGMLDLSSTPEAKRLIPLLVKSSVLLTVSTTTLARGLSSGFMYSPSE